MADTGNEEVIRAVWVDAMKTRGWAQRGGVLQLGPDLNPLNAEFPRVSQLLLEWESASAQSCELELQLQQLDPTVLAGGFPEAALSSGWLAGAFFDGANIWDSDGSTCVILKYETGGGADARVFYSDLRPGRFSLGVQQRVRISVARWLGADPGGATVSIQGSIGPCRHTDSDPVTYSAQVRIPAAQTRTLTMPNGAQWFDWQQAPFSTAIEVSAFGCRFHKDTTLLAPVQVPPCTPYPVIPINGTVMVFENVGAVEAVVTVQFWVR